MQKKKIISINGPVIEAKGSGMFSMSDMVYVGKDNIMGEVIKLNNDIATIQVYEDTTGLKLDEDVLSTEEPLSVILGPGIIGNVFDGIERPLKRLEELSGEFIKKGFNIDSIDLERVWHFIPKIGVGDRVTLNTIVGEVLETSSIKNRIMNSFNIDGEIIFVAEEGDYKVKDVIAKYKDVSGREYEITMYQKWPVRVPRPYKDRLDAEVPLITGQRVIDTMFPIAKGGTAMIPGGFGTGKTMLQHQIAK